MADVGEFALGLFYFTFCASGALAPAHDVTRYVHTCGGGQVRSYRPSLALSPSGRSWEEAAATEVGPSGGGGAVACDCMERWGRQLGEGAGAVDQSAL